MRLKVRLMRLKVRLMRLKVRLMRLIVMESNNIEEQDGRNDHLLRGFEHVRI